MLLDRDLIIDAFENLSEFEKAGLHAPVRWNSAIPSGWDDFWIDPKNNAKELGEGGANYQYNAAEAKKLMAAAGHTSALETQYTYPPGQWGAAWDKQAEVVRGMLEEHGDFKLKTVTLNYQTEFRGKYFQGSDKHEPFPMDDWSVPPYVLGSKRSVTDLDPNYPLLPYGKDSKRTLMAKAVLTKEGVKQVSFVPMMINTEYQPEVLHQGDPRFDDQVQYLDWASEGFNHRFRVDGDDVIIESEEAPSFK